MLEQRGVVFLDVGFGKGFQRARVLELAEVHLAQAQVAFLIKTFLLRHVGDHLRQIPQRAAAAVACRDQVAHGGALEAQGLHGHGRPAALLDRPAQARQQRLVTHGNRILYCQLVGAHVDGKRFVEVHVALTKRLQFRLFDRGAQLRHLGRRHLCAPGAVIDRVIEFVAAPRKFLAGIEERVIDVHRAFAEHHFYPLRPLHLHAVTRLEHAHGHLQRQGTGQRTGDAQQAIEDLGIEPEHVEVILQQDRLGQAQRGEHRERRAVRAVFERRPFHQFGAGVHLVEVGQHILAQVRLRRAIQGHPYRRRQVAAIADAHLELGVAVELVEDERLLALDQGRVHGFGGQLDQPGGVGRHHQPGGARYGRRQQRDQRLLAHPGRIDEIGFAIEVHAHDGVIEHRGRGTALARIGGHLGVDQHRLGLDAHLRQQGDQQHALVLAIAEAAPQHLVRHLRAVRIFAQRHAEVADLVLHPAQRGAGPFGIVGAAGKALRQCTQLGRRHRLFGCRPRGRCRRCRCKQRVGPLRHLLPAAVFAELQHAGAHHVVGHAFVERKRRQRLAFEAQAFDIADAFDHRRQAGRVGVAHFAPVQRRGGRMRHQQLAHLLRNMAVPLVIVGPGAAEHRVGAFGRIDDLQRVAHPHIVEQQLRRGDAHVEAGGNAGFLFQQADVDRGRAVEHGVAAQDRHPVQRQLLVRGTIGQRVLADFAQLALVIDLHRAVDQHHRLGPGPSLGFHQAQHDRPGLHRRRHCRQRRDPFRQRGVADEGDVLLGYHRLGSGQHRRGGDVGGNDNDGGGE